MRYSQFQSPAIDWKVTQSWLTKSILDQILGIRISQIWNLFKHTEIAVIQTFILDQIDKKVKNWEKSLTFLYIKRTLGLAYFPHFGGKTWLSKNYMSLLTPCWVPEKPKSQFQEQDRPYMTLLVMARGPIRK